MIQLRVCCFALLFFFYGLSVVSAQATYYVTEMQLNELSSLITNLENSNKSMTSLLDLQMSEYEKLTKEYQVLEKNYNEKSQIATKQAENYQQLLKLSSNRELIYKYGIAGAFIVGVLVGVFVAK